MNIKQTLSDLDIRPSKRRGQNFLISSSDAERIARSAQIDRDTVVLEIGPGLGALTRELLRRTSKLLLVEIEPKFVDYLKSEISDLGADQILNQDILKTNAEQIAKTLGVNKFVVVSNVPYSISTDVVLWIIENRRFISRASLLLQKEFAERLAAMPGTRACGSLSVLREMYANANISTVISGRAFHPPTEVDSIVASLELLPNPRIPVDDETKFFKVVRALFAHRRKTILNNLKAAQFVDSKEDGERLLLALGISPKKRAEALELQDFETIARGLS